MIPLFKPHMPELPMLDEILHSGFLSYGKYAQQFEEELKQYFNTKYLIVTNTFSAAIAVASTALKIKNGDEIIVSPMACLASTQSYASSGHKIVWADVDPKRGTLDPESVEHKITSSTKAIIHNHFCGYPGYIDEIDEIGRRLGIPVIDDGIECFGSEYKGEKIGKCGGDITIFSLSAARILNTIDGGILIFKDNDLYKKSILIRDCGIERSQFRDELGEINLKCDIKETGYSATMSDVNGYIGLQQMKCVDDLIQKHRDQAEKWISYFAKSDDNIPIYCKECNPNYWVFGILANNKSATIKSFRNIGYYASGVHIKNNIYSIFEKQNSLPGVDDFYNHFMALPSGWWMSK